jgi:hypothetical protein
MPYQSYTNETDSDFAAQLDRYKMGPGVSPGGSAYWASEVAMNAMGNDSMNVARLMEARASLHGKSMDTRRAVAEDRTMVNTEDEFSDFSREMRERVVPGNYEDNAAFYHEAAQRYGHNPKARVSIDALRQADAGLIASRGFRSQHLDNDEYERTRAEREQIDNTSRRLSMNQMDMVDRNLKEAATKSDQELSLSIANNIGVIFDRNQDAVGPLAELSYHLTKGSNKDRDAAMALNGIVGQYAKSVHLESAYSAELGRSIGSIDKIGKGIGVDFRVVKSREDYEAFVVNATKYLSSRPPEEQARGQQALADYSKFFASQLLREKLGNDLVAHAKKRPDSMTGPDAEKWKAGLARLELEAGIVGGMVAEKQRDLANKQAMEDRDIDLRKRSIDILSKEADIKLKADNQDLRLLKHEWEKARFSRAEQMRLLTTAASGGKTPKQIEKLYDELDRMWQEESSKLPSAGGSLYAPTTE